MIYLLTTYDFMKSGRVKPVKRRHIQLYHRVVYPTALSLVACILRQFVGYKELHGIGIVVDVDKALSGKANAGSFSRLTVRMV